MLSKKFLMLNFSNGKIRQIMFRSEISQTFTRRGIIGFLFKLRFKGFCESWRDSSLNKRRPFYFWLFRNETFCDTKRIFTKFKHLSNDGFYSFFMKYLNMKIFKKIVPTHWVRQKLSTCFKIHHSAFATWSRTILWLWKYALEIYRSLKHFVTLQ